MIPFRELVDRFNRQLERATREGLVEPTAFSLATLGANGGPSTRMMLLKEVDDRGFIFYTNLESRKGRDLASAPKVAMCFWWGALAEQVRIEGAVERVSDAEADAYFASRPRGSQIGAWASSQSRTLSSRQELLNQVERVESLYRGREVPRPPHWSGFRLVPDRIEFWYGRPDRLHERFEYTRSGDGWTERILAP
jgi:pyridoxamine 5'-phosphate oxidase